MCDDKGARSKPLVPPQSSPWKSSAERVFRTHLIPLFLMLVSPPAVQFVWVVCVHYKGSLLSALSSSPHDLLQSFPSPTLHAIRLAFLFLLLQLFLLQLVPGKRFVAITTPMGNSPEYKLNGVACFLLTQAFLLSLQYAGIWRYAEVYDHFGPMLAGLNIFALIATALLYIKGIYMPTNSDSGHTGHGFIWDLWQGTELHPEIAGVSLKQLVNCRFAMMGWAVLFVSYTFKQRELYGYVSNSMAVSTTLQLVYIFKFFVWEGGYFNSVDIIHDRFGFYIFWGCTAFLPSIYTLTSLYLTTHPRDLPSSIAVLILLCGLASVYVNYDTDRQRQYFRATNGKCTIWGKAPRIIHAKYTTGDGESRNSILLASGWWGIARHVNYVFEIALAVAWSLPAGMAALIPYIYVSFLTILLVDRAYRDELRCKDKYGRYYQLYCDRVPYKMIPGVY